MVRRRAVPVRVKPQVVKRPRPVALTPVGEAVPPVTEAEGGVAVHAPSPPAEEVPEKRSQPEEDELEMWRDRALRLEAEMDNFRKRQRRLAEGRVAADHERLLRAFLAVGDDLDRAISVDGVDIESLRQGVHIAYQGLMQLLNQEGVEPVPAARQPFDPAIHEAVGTASHQEAGVEPDTVVEEVLRGYRVGERLLRPAKVIVAT